MIYLERGSCGLQIFAFCIITKLIIVYKRVLNQSIDYNKFQQVSCWVITITDILELVIQVFLLKRELPLSPSALYFFRRVQL